MYEQSPLIIHHQYQKLPFPSDKLHQMANLIYKKEHISQKKRTQLILCSDYMIRKLNSDYRDKDKATDVLSFEFGDPDLLGEIYISIQRAKVQARRFGITYDEEILRLFVHGMFHLQGFDHENETDRDQMEKKEQKYIKF